MSTQVAELVTKLSFTGSLDPIEDLNSNLTSAIGNITMVTTAISASTVIFGGWLASILSTADAQAQLSHDTNISMGDLQTWGYMASVTGSSAEIAEESILELSKTIGNAAVDGSEDFDKLGISVKDANGEVKNSSQVLYEMQEAFEKMGLSSQEQLAYIDRFGMDKSMLGTLKLTGKEMDALRDKAKALGLVTQEDADKILAFNSSMTTLKYSMDSVQKRIAISFAPQLTSLSDNFTDLLIANNELVDDGFKKFFEVVNSGFGALYNFGKLFYGLIDNTIGWNNALYISATAMLYLNRAMLANPVVLITAGIVALISVVDDLTVDLQGGEGVIRDWLMAWTGIDINKVILDLWQTIADFSADVMQTWNDIPDSMKRSFEDAKSYIRAVINDIIKFFEPLLKIFDLVSNFEMPSFDLVSNFEMPSLDGVLSSIGSDLPMVAGENNVTPSYAGVIPNLNTSNRQTTNNNNIKIEVRSDNPQVAGDHVATAMNAMLADANDHFSR